MHFISTFTRIAVAEVFDTMLSLKLEALETLEGADVPHGPLEGVVGSVGFAGKINGTLYMRYSDKLACSVTERLIGVTPVTAADSEVADVIGEIANMVSGTMKGQTSKQGYHGWLSTPMILRGSEIFLESKSAPISSMSRFRLPISNDRLEVWVFAKLED